MLCRFVIFSHDVPAQRSSSILHVKISFGRALFHPSWCRVLTRRRRRIQQPSVVDVFLRQPNDRILPCVRTRENTF